MNRVYVFILFFVFNFLILCTLLALPHLMCSFEVIIAQTLPTQCTHIIIRINGEIDILPLLFYCSFIFLFLEHYGVRKLEAVFAILIGTMALSFAWMFGDTKPNGKELLIGTKIDFVCLLIRRMESY